MSPRKGARSDAGRTKTSRLKDDPSTPSDDAAAASPEPKPRSVTSLPPRRRSAPAPESVSFDPKRYERAVRRAEYHLDRDEVTEATRELEFARRLLDSRDQRDPKRADLERELSGLESRASDQRSKLFTARQAIHEYRIDGDEVTDERIHRYIPWRVYRLLKRAPKLREQVDAIPESHRAELHAVIDETVSTLKAARVGSVIRWVALATLIAVGYGVATWVPQRWNSARFNDTMTASRTALSRGDYQVALDTLNELDPSLAGKRQKEATELRISIVETWDRDDFARAVTESERLIGDGEFDRARLALEGYLSRRNGAISADDARARIKALETEWDLANYESARGRVATLLGEERYTEAQSVWRDYLDGEPTPQHADVVMKSVDAIAAHADEAAYAEIEQLAVETATGYDFAGALGTLEAYLQERPDGRFRTEAVELKARLAQSWDEYDYRVAERDALSAERQGDRDRAIELWRAYVTREGGALQSKRAEAHVRQLESGLSTWPHALASIADPTTCPLYNGLQIVEQAGFAPWRRNPTTGLWEFIDSSTGSNPKPVVTDADAVIFVLLPGGVTAVGAQRGDPDAPNYDSHARANEGPIRTVTLEPLFIAKYELTQAQASRLLGQNPSRFSAGSTVGGRAITLLHPAESLSWSACLSLALGEGWQMPTESQWEYAARSGSPDPWYTGESRQSLLDAASFFEAREDFDLSRLELPYLAGATNILGATLPADTWAGDGYPVHAPVGQFRPNAFGLHDMLGNVHEWCRPDPEGDDDSGQRAARGGDFLEPSYGLRVSRRAFAPQESESPRIGFRPSRAVQTR